jgi:hypothetical protein
MLLLFYRCRAAAVCCVYWQVSFAKPNEMRYFCRAGSSKKFKKKEVQQGEKEDWKGIGEIIHNS